MALNKRLRIATMERGITQVELAKRVGIHETRLSKIARGYLEPNDGEKRAIAKVLRTSVDQIFGSEVSA